MGCKQRAVVLLVVGMMMVMLPMAYADSAKKQAAETAALSWVKLVDDGDYAASWDDAAPYLKNAIPKNQWEKGLAAVRKPLGRMLSRKLKSATYTTSLPGAPDGEYVVIQFNTSFQNKESAVETITPMLDKDGQWRVSGYYIK